MVLKLKGITHGNLLEILSREYIRVARTNLLIVRAAQAAKGVSGCMSIHADIDQCLNSVHPEYFR